MKKFEVKHGNNVSVRGKTSQCEAADDIHFRG